jgi:hypothetical protein
MSEFTWHEEQARLVSGVLGAQSDQGRPNWMNLRIFPIHGVGDPFEALADWVEQATSWDASPLVNMRGRPTVDDVVLVSGNELAFAIETVRARYWRIA